VGLDQDNVERKIEFQTLGSQTLVASRCTDCGIPASCYRLLPTSIVHHSTVPSELQITDHICRIKLLGMHVCKGWAKIHQALALRPSRSLVPTLKNGQQQIP
jgi:hypothetical protein